MNPADPIDILLTQDRWAMLRLLDTCRGLTNEQFHRRFPMGLGSLHDTILHIVSANRASPGRHFLASLVNDPVPGAEHAPLDLLQLLLPVRHERLQRYRLTRNRRAARRRGPDRQRHKQ